MWIFANCYSRIFPLFSDGPITLQGGERGTTGGFRAPVGFYQLLVGLRQSLIRILLGLLKPMELYPVP